MRSSSWAAVKFLQWVQFNFSVTAVKPPPKWVEVGLQWSFCSECISTFQWLQSNHPHPPPPESGVEVQVAVKFLQWVQFNSDFQWVGLQLFNFSVTAVPPPPTESGVEVGLQWSFCSECSSTFQWLQWNPPSPQEWGVEVRLQWSFCSECSSTFQWLQFTPPPPPPPTESGVEVGLQKFLQWVQFNFSVTAVKPPPPPPRMRSSSWAAVKFLQWVQFNFSVTAVKPPSPPNQELKSGCRSFCSECSSTFQWLQSNPPPPQNEEFKLGCSECSSTFQWLQSNPPLLEWGVEVGCSEVFAVSAVQLFSDCSQTPLPPGMRSWSQTTVKFLWWVQLNFSVTAVKLPSPQNEEFKLGCSECSSTFQWLQSNPPSQNEEFKLRCSEVFAVSAVKLFSDCSQTPPPRMRSSSWAAVKFLQWVQFNFLVTAVKPPLPPGMRSWSQTTVKFLQWVQFNFLVTAVNPPPPQNEELKLGCSEVFAVSAVQLFSDCSQTHAPPQEWGVEVGLQWSFCSECSSTFQWLQSNPPPPGTLQNCNFRILNI